MINIFTIISSFLRTLYYIKRNDNSISNQTRTWKNQDLENEEEVFDSEDENQKWEDFIQDDEEDK